MKRFTTHCLLLAVLSVPTVRTFTVVPTTSATTTTITRIFALPTTTTTTKQPTTTTEDSMTAKKTTAASSSSAEESSPPLQDFAALLRQQEGWTTDITFKEARDLYGVAAIGNDDVAADPLMKFLQEPFEFPNRSSRIDAASFILGFPISMKLRLPGSILLGKRSNKNKKLSCCCILYPCLREKKNSFWTGIASFWTNVWAYYKMTRDGIRLPHFFYNPTERNHFLKMVQHMDKAADQWHHQHGPTQDHWCIFAPTVEPTTATATTLKQEMMQTIVRVANQTQQPLYCALHGDDTRAFCQELGFQVRATQRITDPVDESREGFEAFVLTREPTETLSS